MRGRAGGVTRGGAIGALAVILAVAALAVLRAPAAHALLDSCTAQTDIFNDYPTNGTLGFQAQLQCSSSGASINGTACFWVSPETYNNWQRTAACDSQVTNGRIQTLQLFVPCYTDVDSWRYQVRASWVVHFPDGNYYGYNDTSTIRTVPCSSPALISSGGGK